MKVLLVGQGGREHAIAWKIGQSPKVEKVFCAPGNAGMEKVAERVSISSSDLEGLLQFARQNRIDLTLVGPEAPLVGGMVDRFRAEGLRIFGPDRYASQLEGSKIFAKQLMQKLNIPTASFQVFDDPEVAMDYVAKSPFPLVIKADGLAAGKGVSIVHSRAEAVEAVHLAMIKKVFGQAGERLVIEDCLEGVEASLIAISDGRRIVSLASSQDHKRIFDGDQGPNTGGMGAYSPAPFVSEEIRKEAEERVFKPLTKEFYEQGHPFVGFLYAGVMVGEEGLKVLEFNVRFGDPEAQVILPRLESDFFDLIWDCCNGRLEKTELRWKDEDCVCVVLASGGYPGDYEKGVKIAGIDIAAGIPHVLVFHAGTEKKEGHLVTSGGRVLNVVASGQGLFQALSRCYEAVHKIYFSNMQYRKDIGSRALKNSHSGLSSSS